ncbi:MAG: tetratricopeptide repeat protein, partial [Acidobacteria bacterium]|nr:tetratricopeptide repeat protein [Acidobacteriota bacterium]
LLLYEVLTGHRPFESSSGSPLALARAIAEEEPALPSRLLEAQADRTYRLDRDLDAILLTALRKEPEQRYASVEQLADDLQRYLDGLPVLARRGNLLYRTGKLIRRHRVAVAAGVLLFLTTFGFAVAMKRQATRTAEERDRAREVESFLVDAFRQADPLATGEIVTARQVLDRGAARLTDRLGPFPETRAALLQSIGEAYLGLGEAQTAEELLRKGLASAQEDLPTDRRVRILAALSVALRMQSLFDESERRAREAVELAESLGEAAHPEPYLATEALAGLLVETQRSPEAEALFLENLERLEQSGSADPENRIRTLEGLSDAHLQQAEYSEALSSLQEALKLREAQPGPQEIGVAMLRLKIANVHLFRGEDREGKTLFEASLPPLVDHLGEEHPTVMTAREALANALTNLGELEAAEGMYRDLLASRIRVFGDRSEAVAMIRHNYAKLLNDRGDHEGAVELARQSLDALVEVMGPDHGEVQMARTSYGNHLMNAGRFKEAQAQLETALASARALEAPLHYGAGFPLEKLGELALAQSRPEEAIPYFEEALAIWQSPPDPRPMRVAYASGKLGRCLRELGRYEEAETHLLRTAKTFDELYPRGHAMRRGIRQGLLALYRLWEKPEDVRLQEALLRQEEASGGQGS